MVINIQDDILRLSSLGLLTRILQDKTTKKNIMWATDAYGDLGREYSRDEEIKADLISGQNAGVIKTRARKAMEQQSDRTKAHGEVFTPMWVCNVMNNHLDEVWFGRPDVKELQKLINIIDWNIWQMDGLTGTIPYSRAQEQYRQMTLFDMFGTETEEKPENRQPLCRIYDWRADNSLEFNSLNKNS